MNKRRPTPGGGCFEFAFGGNHTRAWPQTVGSRTAWFLSVSEEHDCTGQAGRFNLGPIKGIYHCIDSNGFNQCRDDFVADVKACAKQVPKDLCALVICVNVDPWEVYNYTIEYRPEYGRVLGYNRVRYDGLVAIIKVTATM